ncbi:MAG TPA: patatin-like phospholipase family protein [Gemmata sp.]|nr:patatin-like phospholipase family protein [Gemmata sp.]
MLIIVAVVLAPGCRGRHETNAFPAQYIGKPWKNVGDTPAAHDGDTEAVSGLSEVLAGREPPPRPGRPLNVLVMSGGGKYGAFTAGILNGWTASGTRPTFDVATGVSSGALIATLAFLGPKYDEKMAFFFTTLQRSTVYQFQILRGLCSRMGIMTAEPLEIIVRGVINDEFMCDLQAAHSEGRRLYVGTCEVQTNRPVIWDIGAIASSSRPDARELLVKILTAACTPPAVVKPTEIVVEINGVNYREFHTDGGNMLQAFVRTPAEIPAGSTFWALSAGKYYRDPPEGPPRILSLFGGAVSNSLYALFRSDLMKLYALCAVTRSNFRLIALPQDFKVSSSAFAFDPAELERLYWVGYQMTANGGQWRNAPPDTLPGEATPPRTGTQFISP